MLDYGDNYGWLRLDNGEIRDQPPVTDMTGISLVLTLSIVSCEHSVSVTYAPLRLN